MERIKLNSRNTMSTTAKKNRYTLVEHLIRRLYRVVEENKKD